MTHSMRLVTACLLVALLSPILALADQHDQAPDSAEQSTQVDFFLRLLAEPEVQAWLTEQAEIEAPPSAPDSELGMPMAEPFEGLRERIRVLMRVAPDIPSLPGRIAASWVGNLSASDLLRGATYLLIFLFVGAGLEWLYLQFTDSTRVRLSLHYMPSLRARSIAACKRFALMCGGLLAFSVGAIGAYLLFDWQQAMAELVLITLAVVVAARLTSMVSRFVLAPDSPRLRLLGFETDFARVVHRWNVGAACTSFGCIAVAMIGSRALQREGGVDSDTSALALTSVAGLISALIVTAAVWHAYYCYRQSTNSATGTRYTWPIYLTVLTLFTYVLWLIGLPRLSTSVAVIGLMPPLFSLLGITVNDLFDQAERRSRLNTAESEADEDPEGDEVESDLNDYSERDYGNYRPVALRLIRFLLIASALVILVSVWGSDLRSMGDDSGVGAMLASIVIDVIAAVLLADLVWVWAKTAIDRRLADYEPPSDGKAPGPEARMATLLPLLRSVLMITLLLMVGLTVLSSLGVNIAPLIAGAGVLGVAVGFGAQALVRDIVSGVFFLIDDAFRIGEYIEIENLRGTVESMSIRSLRVRHHRGAVHTIPFGELKSLTNHSRDWVIMKLEFRVPFETDLKLVKKLVKQVGAELKENADYGDSIIQTLKSQGVRRMEEFNMVIGVKFMARPGEQWVIRRDAYMKVRDTFDNNGLNFAERNVKVEVLGADPKDPAVQEAAAAAVQGVMENKGPPLPIPDEP